jgi:hypothetical protein
LASSSAASEREQAVGIAFDRGREMARKGHEKVASHLEAHIEECLTCLGFPESHRRSDRESLFAVLVAAKIARNSAASSLRLLAPTIPRRFLA